jgi:hypothetical protein
MSHNNELPEACAVDPTEVAFTVAICTGSASSSRRIGNFSFILVVNEVFVVV